MNYKYGIVIYWSEADQVCVAEVPELPGCMAHGDDPRAAVASVLEAVALWIETAKVHGDVVPEPKKRRLIFA
ncbi:MAG: type II toxin-antitoxin system HicB family antitoxin [Isosphaeraceae bacterium]